jgi:hypothetical protein
VQPRLSRDPRRVFGKNQADVEGEGPRFRQDQRQKGWLLVVRVEAGGVGAR